MGYHKMYHFISVLEFSQKCKKYKNRFFFYCIKHWTKTMLFFKSHSNILVDDLKASLYHQCRLCWHEQLCRNTKTPSTFFCHDNNNCVIFTWILGDKTIDDKLMYIQNYDKQNNLFCRLKLHWHKSLDTV